MNIGELVDAGAIGVLVILMIFVFNYMSKRDQQVTDREKSWQAFLEARDEQWQTFIKSMSETDNKVLSELRDVIQAVKTELGSLRSDFHDHEEWERSVLQPSPQKKRIQ